MSSATYLARLEIRTEQELPEPNVLLVEGDEAIGKPYRVRVRFSLPQVQLRDDDPVVATDWPGTPATLYLEEERSNGLRDAVRTIHGVIAEVEEGLEGPGKGRRVFDVVLVPRFALLANVVVQAVYVGLGFPDIVREKLGTVGFEEGTDFELRLSDPGAYADALPDGRAGDGAKPPVEGEPRLTVQYKESDLAFLSRLSEHLGVSILFEQGDDGERVIFTDHTGGFAKRDEPIPFRTGAGKRGVEKLTRRCQAVPTSAYVVDYNYRAPDQQFADPKTGEIVFDTLGARSELDVDMPGAVVEYAPNVKTAREAEFIANVRADELESRRERWKARGDHAALATGVRILVDDHPVLTDDHELLIVDARWTYRSTEGMGDTGDVVPGFEVDLSAVTAVKTTKKGGRAIVFRPARTTPKPRIHGCVTGIVQRFSGTSGRLQNLDHEGRYQVHFHFDPGVAPMPRIRMGQPHAGPGYGMHFPLRPGIEVIVAFLDGDPDRPFILGAVPNPHMASPVFVPQPDASEALLARNVEVHRIQTKSGVVIEIGDSVTPSDLVFGS